MSKPPDSIIRLTDTLSLSEYKDPKNGNFGFWLYDETRGMNLAMKAKSERIAFTEALDYYQKRLTTVETDLKDIKNKVDIFISQFYKEDDNFL